MIGLLGKTLYHMLVVLACCIKKKPLGFKQLHVMRIYSLTCREDGVHVQFHLKFDLQCMVWVGSLRGIQNRRQSRGSEGLASRHIKQVSKYQSLAGGKHLVQALPHMFCETFYLLALSHTLSVYNKLGLLCTHIKVLHCWLAALQK